MALDTQEHEIRKDAKGRIRQIRHPHTLYRPAKKPSSDTPKALAAEYIKEVFGIKKVLTHAISSRDMKKAQTTRKSENELWYVTDKQVIDTTVVEFEQRCNGIRVWHGGASVLLKADASGILSATNSFDYDIPTMKVDRKLLAAHAKAMDAKQLSELVALDKNLKRLKKARADIKLAKPKITVNKIDQVLYCYVPKARQEPEKHPEGADRDLAARLLELVLPAVKKGIKAGQYYIVTEVLFMMDFGKFALNWHALIEPETNSVVYIRPLVAQSSGWVYEHDPITLTGDASIVPGSPTEVLNAVRTPKVLPGITALPALNGEYIQISEINDPIIAPPTSASGRFDYDADTDDFSAVNAYYGSDKVFRMVEEMGFDMGSYFDGTSFPVPVDHRGCFGCVNAAAWGNAGNDGLGSFTYGLIEVGQPVGIASSIRIVLHEFGHAILWDNVHSPNFGFSHSAGDSLAAMLCDPRSKALDRYQTFPWLMLVNADIDRRHDRDIAAGWAWGGTEDDGGYGSEQILSTTNFRAYRALGGDHPELCEREWAARYMSYLVLHGVGTLTPATNPNNPDDWAGIMMSSDIGTTVFEGHPGGMVHKVIRWAFEKQGAFQPVGAPSPVVTEGAPPLIDVYINDGRNGEYPYTLDYCHTADIWNRNCPDANPEQQAPIPGIDNYAYVIVRNRGTQQTSKGRVRAYHKRENGCCGCCDDCQELTWPNDFMPATTDELPLPPVAPGDYEIIGPFVWRPGPNDCLLVSVDVKGDLSNIHRVAPGNSLRIKHLVPFDNNIALRCMCKQCNLDYSRLTLKPPCREVRKPGEKSK